MNQSQRLAAMAKATGGRAPRLVPAADFDRAFKSSTSGLSIRQACRRILVDGWTWQRAAATHGVSFGGLSKAMRKAGLR